jgi:hypothetical protein
MWRRFLYSFALTGGVGLGLCLAVVLLADPLGVSPLALVRKPGFAFDDPRFFAPQLLADENFDSYLIGTSTIHSVDPQWSEKAFGGHFAIIALQGGTPYELSRVVKALSARHGVRRVIFGIDATTWCKTQHLKRFRDDAVFPEWLYDEYRLNDLAALLNLQMVRFSLRQLAIAFGAPPAVPGNGYRNHLDDAKWDARKARKKLYGSKEPATVASRLSETENARVPLKSSDAYPALRLLQEAFSTLSEAEFIVALMPFHASVRQGSAGERRRLEDCKQSIVNLLGKQGVHVVDFNIDSPWTTNDDNYWDRSHIRVGVARSFIFHLAEAIARREDADDGVYRYLSDQSGLPSNMSSSPHGSDKQEAATRSGH